MKLIEEKEVIKTLMEVDSCGKGDAEWLAYEMEETKVLQEIRKDISNISGHEDCYTSMVDRPSLVQRVRDDCIGIIDKHLEQNKEEMTSDERRGNSQNGVLQRSIPETDRRKG